MASQQKTKCKMEPNAYFFSLEEPQDNAFLSTSNIHLQIIFFTNFSLTLKVPQKGKLDVAKYVFFLWMSNNIELLFLIHVH